MTVTRVVIRKPIVPHLEALAARWGYEDLGEVVNLLVANAALSVRGECPIASMGTTTLQAMPSTQLETQNLSTIEHSSVNDFGIDISAYSLG